MTNRIEFLSRGTVCATWNPRTREITTAEGEVIVTGVNDEYAADWEVRDFFDDCAPITSRPAPGPVDPELFARTAPQWNCVDYADGMHYTPDGDCAWCGKTRAQIAAEYQEKETK